MTAQRSQECLWQGLFSDPAQWWDNRRSKTTPRHPDFRHKESRSALWLHDRYKPAWVESQRAMWDAGLGRPPELAPTSVQSVFGTLTTHDAELELEMCRKLCEGGQLTEAVDALDLLVTRRCRIPNNLFYRVLKSCIAQKDLALGRRIHALIVKSGYEGDAFVATHLIGLYASHGRLEEAMRVFAKVPAPSAYTWSTIIFAHARHGESTEAIRLYRRMSESSVQPDNHIFLAVLKACATAGDIAAGKNVHAHISATAGKSDMFVQNSLVDMYAKCGSLEDAQAVFDGLSCKDVVTWTAMIAGYARQGRGQEALKLYSGMQQDGIAPPNAITFVCLLQACASVGEIALQQGKQLHAQIDERGLHDNVVIGGSLVNMYSKCGSLEDAVKVFHNLPRKNVVTWNALMTGYAQQGMGEEALSLYSSMQQEGIFQPNPITFVCLLQACASLGEVALNRGKQLHAQIAVGRLQDDVVVGGSLVNMYAKCGSLEDAHTVFQKLSYKNVVTWNAMIAGYVQQGMGEEALGLYSSMQEENITPPDCFTLVCLLQACSSLGGTGLDVGKKLHAQIKERGLQDDVVVGGSLVNMYAKCGRIEDARRLFDQVPHKNIVTWNAIITGYVQQGAGDEAFRVYSDMQQEGITLPDSVTFVCLLQACGALAALPLARQLHAQIEELGLQDDAVVGNGLVDMYGKCGSMVDAQQVFDSLPERDIVAWDALIAGYSRQGDSEAVFDLVDRMRQEGIQPNGITFVAVLAVCSHAGLVDKGRKYVNEVMSADYGVSPSIEHYTCVIDLLGRAGELEEALRTVEAMPFPPDYAVWLTLLGACRKWNNVEIARQAFEHAASLDETDASSYVLMSNIYAGAQMWDEAKEMRARRVRSRAWKPPGQCWWTDVGGVVHRFGVGDKEHPESPGVYARLEQLIPSMKEAGYVPHLGSALRDTPDAEKQAELCAHSEKLAIAYALNKTAEGTTIRVVKNLRACVDCHTATAFIAKIEKRTIITRDATRFHVYNKDGKCSCGDYW